MAEKEIVDTLDGEKEGKKIVKKDTKKKKPSKNLINLVEQKIEEE